MTITTRNSNPKNDSQCARHRSILKLDSVVENLKKAPGGKHKRFHGTPRDVRDMWKPAFFDQGLPAYDPGATAAEIIQKSGYAGVLDWLGNRSPFTDDVKVIWADFGRIFAKRSNPGKNKVHPDGSITIEGGGKGRELLFVSCTNQHFDLIYSKWGYEAGKHWFFHWTSAVPQSVNRATIDEANDDQDGEGVDND